MLVTSMPFAPALVTRVFAPEEFGSEQTYRPVSVAADDDAVLGPKAGNDAGDRADEVGTTGWILNWRRRILQAAVMNQEDERSDADETQGGRIKIGGVHLAEEGDIGDAGGVHDPRRVRQGNADDADRNALDEPDLDRQQDRQAGPSIHDVGGEMAVGRAGEAVAVLAAVHRMTTATLQSQELRDALVELVVAHCRHVQPELRQQFDGRLVVERGAEERRCADHVAGADGEHVLVVGASFRAQPLEPRRQVLDAAGRHAIHQPARRQSVARARHGSR